MDPVPERINFPEEEQKILEYWEEIKAFETSVKRSEGLPEFSFYDGPPFATGLPHYGHILAGTIKDTITRYAHQTGHHVERRFGWDCHGLPIEFEIDKQLGIKTKEQVLELGIPKYNAACRAIVMKYSSEWRTTVTRLGRWIDFDNDYKTMDLSFMETVWWVFKQLFEKDYVYRGFKVMPYSTSCTTPLSNFEAGMNYKDVPDPEVYVSFPLVDEADTYFIAWTTTPWTLPSNLALCVNPELEYVKIEETASGKKYIMLEGRLSGIYPTKKAKKGAKVELPYKILEKFKGATLKGKQYVPLFDYFKEFGDNGAFRIVTADYVKSDSGTGVVHQAPAFGEDDYLVCIANGVIKKGGELPCPLDENGRFTDQVPEHKGVFCKDADKAIIAAIKKSGRLIKSGTMVHSYPFCWRSDTPLIYKAIPSWFVKVEQARDRILANSQQTYWVPEHVRDGRFHNWLTGARDWAVSRNRYWGTPLPIWASEDFEEIICVGSIAELKELSGVEVTDLHRETVDNITIPSKKGKGNLRRIDEVFDCWFESGSMPYAQRHYPFENKDSFEKAFPADFIAEGIDQTRGWFYTLLVLSTLLFEKPAFKNLIANGLVLASDGKKMSKRLKNYPDPVLVVNSYGADSLRMYLVNSPVVRGEDLKFQEVGVKNVLKDVLLPWFNAYRFLVQSILAQETRLNKPFAPDSNQALSTKNVMDKWVLARANSLVAYVKKEMDAYHLYTVMPRLVVFIEELTNWYVRLNRLRLKGEEGEEECTFAVNTLFEVVLLITRTMAPFTPFFTEYVYQNLRKCLPESEREDSLHYLLVPEARMELMDEHVENAFALMQSAINSGRVARERRVLPLKKPLKEAIIILPSQEAVDLVNKYSLAAYIQAELNVRQLRLVSEAPELVRLTAQPNRRALGRRLNKDASKVFKAVASLTDAQLKAYKAEGKLEVAGHELVEGDLNVDRAFTGNKEKYEGEWDSNVVVVIAVEQDEELRNEGVVRNVMSHIQRLRKESGVQVEDAIEVFFDCSTPRLQELVASKVDFIMTTVKRSVVPASRLLANSLVIGTSTFFPDDEQPTESCTVTITPEYYAVDAKAAKAASSADATGLQTLLMTSSLATVAKELEESGGKLCRTLNGTRYELTLGKELYLGVANLP
mmetsp:Transcript_13786/g.54523  ORF Transcript_13786/g.54523 Transcript_13786/m.54523 type:complete len:1146 (-) Transcript_13786:51-3488(-)